MLRKISSIICVLGLFVLFTACNAATSEDLPTVSDAASETAVSESEQETLGTTTNETEAETETTTTEGADTLVIVFSCTGTTKGVADKIVTITGADLYEITAAEPYTDEDRDWNNPDSRCSVEQNDVSARPEIGSEKISLEGYSVIYIGYPIWFGQEPRIMDTFVESYDFGTATVIPFCTSGSSDIGQSGTNLETLAGSGVWLEGKRFDGGVTEDELTTWIESLDI